MTCFRVFADEELDRSLLVAAKAGNSAKVREALVRGASPHFIEPLPGLQAQNGHSSLYNAVLAQAVDCVKLLLEAGADPLKASKEELWTFGLAAAFQDTSTNRHIVELMLDALKQLPARHDTLIDFVVYPAAKRGDGATLKRLASLGLDIGATSKAGNTLFFAAAEAGRFDEAEQWLNQYGTQYSESTNEVRVSQAIDFVANRPFYDAKLARLLRQAQGYGFKLQSRDPSRSAPIWNTAVLYRLAECAQVLGCPPDEQRKIVARSPEELALVAACNADSLPVFTNLLRNVFDSAQDRKAAASRLLFDLLRNKHPYWRLQMVALEHLMLHGADADYEEMPSTNLLRTSFEAAMGRTDLPLVKWMVEHGADINHVSGKRMTPLHWAVIVRNLEITNWLLEHGARIQEAETGRPLLVYAVTGEAREAADALIPVLLKAGADPYMRGSDGKSMVDILADRLDVLRLREIDTKRQYADLLRRYSPPAASPFIGVWWNEEDEFKTFSLILNDEGMAIVGTSIMPLGPFPWRTTDASRAIIELVEKDKREEIVVQFVASENALRISSPSAAATRILKKQPEKPLKMSEYRKQMSGK